MPMRRWPVHHRARLLGISLLVLSLVHAPLPLADFHNVRHHDAPGEVCEHHDHLLRWHPDAGQAEDVAVLHWHWILPESGPVEPGHSGDGSMIHAHVSGWDAPQPESGPVVTLDGSSRLLDVPEPSLLALGDAPFATPGDRLDLRVGIRSAGPSAPPRAPDFPRLAAPALVLLSRRPSSRSLPRHVGHALARPSPRPSFLY